jgi:aminoglycoside phosphotransferase (APT) family kinase protein
MHSRVAAFIARRWPAAADGLRVEVQTLDGGLESAVSLATITADVPHPDVPERIVVKELRPGCAREADVYDVLGTHLAQSLSARMLGVDSVGETRYLYLEAVSPASPWPWSDTRAAAAVCRELARLHDSTALPTDVFAWDYDSELARAANLTLAAARTTIDAAGSRFWRRTGDLARVVRALPAIRSQLRAGGRTVIHGDVHPGNVIVRAGHSSPQVALIDWGRARLGSPLEDVASWLHSLGCWEPQARKRHDTLLQTYLRSRRTPRPLDAALRRDYWFGSVSNGLAGAITYHLAILGSGMPDGAARAASRRVLAAWERVVRRVVTLLRD